MLQPFHRKRRFYCLCEGSMFLPKNDVSSGLEIRVFSVLLCNRQNKTGVVRLYE